MFVSASTSVFRLSVIIIGSLSEFSENEIHFPIAQLCWFTSRERRSWHKSSSSFGGAMIFLFVLSSETRARYQSTRQYWVDTDAIAARLIQREAKNGKRRIFWTNLDSRRILKWSRPSEFAHENRERNIPIRGGGRIKSKTILFASQESWRKKSFDCVSGDKGRVRFEGERKSANVLGKSGGEKTRRRKKSKNVCWMLRTHKRSAREMREKVVVQITWTSSGN